MSAKTLNIRNEGKHLTTMTVEELKKGHVDAVNVLNIPYMLNTPKATDPSLKRQTRR
ncbi:hypothetical protein JHK85_001547 [Glycine max]|nr:hypothetical protein JHK85_001547 [Glycine max]